MTSAYDAIPDFGVLYDSVPLYQERTDVGFYVDEAKAAPAGPVLEIGCGTGRILLPIARAGRDICGLDGSAHMLERLRDKLVTEPAAVQSRVSLTLHDMRDFNLGQTFSLIIAPFRVVQHLTSVDDQLRFLATVAKHLAPGGKFVFDVFNPRFDMLVRADGKEHEDTPETRLLDERGEGRGRTFRRAYRIARVRWLEQVSESELIYYVDGKRYVQAFDMRWYLAAELEHLLARAGFRVRLMYGDFARGPVVEGCPEFVVVAEKG